MIELSRHLPGKTYDEEMIERKRRRDLGLEISTLFPEGKSHFESQTEVRAWFSRTFNEWLLWSHAMHKGNVSHHYWLPRTKDQAMLLKLRFGG